MQPAAPNAMPASIQVRRPPLCAVPPHPAHPLTPSPARLLPRQARLEAYKAAKDSTSAEELKAALDAKMQKATAKHEDILKMKVEA